MKFVGNIYYREAHASQQKIVGFSGSFERLREELLSLPSLECGCCRPAFRSTVGGLDVDVLERATREAIPSTMRLTGARDSVLLHAVNFTSRTEWKAWWASAVAALGAL